MRLTFTDTLHPDAVAQLRSSLDHGVEPDGTSITDALRANPLFLLGVEPRWFCKPVFSRYERGMSAHVEAGEAMPCGRENIRADVRVAIPLSDTGEYAGGELVVDTGWGEERVRERAGTCIVYPATARKGMAEVTHGTLWIAELNVQSLVVHEWQREILYDIGYSVSLLEVFGGGRTSELQTLQKCHRNLLRRWASA